MTITSPRVPRARSCTSCVCLACLARVPLACERELFRLASTLESADFVEELPLIPRRARSPWTRRLPIQLLTGICRRRIWRHVWCTCSAKRRASLSAKGGSRTTSSQRRTAGRTWSSALRCLAGHVLKIRMCWKFNTQLNFNSVPEKWKTFLWDHNRQSQSWK